jgi:hypothetical protein
MFAVGQVIDTLETSGLLQWSSHAGWLAAQVLRKGCVDSEFAGRGGFILRL